MKVKFRPIRAVYKTNDYQVYGCVPLEEYTSLELNKYGNFTISGYLPYITLMKVYELNIELSNNKYGGYIVTDTPNFSIADISDTEELEILHSITTPSQAQYVHSAYPNYIRLIIEGKETEIDLKKIHNVGEFRHNAYIRLIKEKYKYFEIIKELKDFELLPSDCKALENKYSTLEEIKKNLYENPYYNLISVCERDFEIVDKLIVSLMPEMENSNQRTESLMLWILDRNEIDSNTRINANDMAQYCIDYAPTLTSKLKDVANESPLIYYDDATKYIAKMGTYLAECKIAQDIKERIEHPKRYNIDWRKYQNAGDFPLTEEQMEFLRISTEQSVGMLLGIAGGGKTASVKTLIKMCEDNNLTYTLLAPTGIASKVLADFTKCETSTIHRRFMKSEPIYSDICICDEISMYSIEHMSMIFQMLTPQTKIFFVGDPNQIPSIGCGNILNDMINSNIIPTARLTKVFRYGKDGIYTMSTDIANGRAYISSDGVPCFDNAEKVTDYQFISIASNPLEQICQAYDELIQKYSYKDIMILSPINIGTFGSLKINETIQEQYNPLKSHTQEEASYKKNKDVIIKFRAGDKIINTQNSYDHMTLEQYRMQNKSFDEFDDNDTALGFKQSNCYNGDIGYVLEIDKGNIIAQFDNNVFVFTKENISQLLLAYCISVYKSQGSQCKAVISITHPTHRYLHRALLYVAATRCQEYLYEIGSVSAINKALDIVEINNRDTFLLDLLREP